MHTYHVAINNNRTVRPKAVISVKQTVCDNNIGSYNGIYNRKVEVKNSVPSIFDSDDVPDA